jgi:hypothetical protein
MGQNAEVSPSTATLWQHQNKVIPQMEHYGNPDNESKNLIAAETCLGFLESMLLRHFNCRRWTECPTKATGQLNSHLQ